ncbi:hypothetical protein [Mariniflexile sp. AS56]|uniref:hypothetical protein n=1 Tax=Mariniflexile sp. AS56 TaxID=3063957 RepID=UPI0026EFD2D9|nr:hypothetical protein [Mariniflexile sp. AS56]MDO7172463.1 hypothetical protein [Mariniflexile sp. AS56]
MNLYKNKIVGSLFVLGLCLFAKLSAQNLIKHSERTIHPYWPSKTWQLRADDITTINLAMTPDVTKDHPIFNQECIEIIKQVRKAVKGY